MFTLPHACKYPFVLLAALLTIFAPQAAPRALGAAAAATAPLRQAAPADGVETGVRLFQRGDFKGAVKALRAALKKKPKNEDRALLYLGHAQMSGGNPKEARKIFDRLVAARPDYGAAHAGLAYLHMLGGNRPEARRAAERALALDRSLVDAYFVLGLISLEDGAWLKVIEAADAMIKLDPRAANAYYLKSHAALGLYNKADAVLSDERRGAYAYTPDALREAREAQPLRLREAADNLEKYLALNPGARDAQLQREQIEALRVYAGLGAPGDTQRVFKATDVTAKAVILKKPDPGFTEEARRNNVTGVVRIRAVLAADGQVKHVFVIRGLRLGLTERAIRAARAIKFKPATFNGVPVSQFVTLEYNFNIY